MEADPDKSGIFWFSFGGTRNSLAEVQALIRPSNWESVSKSDSFNTSQLVATAIVIIAESNPVPNSSEAQEALDEYNVRDFNVRYECVFKCY